MTAAVIPAEQMASMLSVLQHALGKDEYGRGDASRRHFVTGPYSSDHASCVACVEHGLMTRHPPSELTGGDDLFLVTDAGREFVAAHSPTPPQLTRGAARYQRYLDADSSLAFGEWIRA